MSDALMGTFVRISTMADGTPRIILDLQCSLSDIAAMGLIPGVPFAIARLNKEIAPESEKKEPAKEKGGDLCIMACNFCEDKLFQKWLQVTHKDDARAHIIYACDVLSRKDLDKSERAARDFHNRIRIPFLEWKNEFHTRDR